MVAPVEATVRDESVLVARLVAGDESALGELYDQFSSMVFSIAKRIVADAHAAEDVCQEVFVQLWNTADRVDLTRCSLRGWVSVLAHRRSVDWVRRSERARRRDERNQRDQAAAEVLVVDLADLSATEDVARRARAAVAALPPDQRQAIELAFWGGRSYRQVADELGIPEGTAKSRVRLALARLAAALEEVR